MSNAMKSMTERKPADERSDWRIVHLFLLTATIILLVALIVIGYSVEWTGFGQSSAVDNIRPAKTLWDWLDMIVAPLILAIVGIVINSTIRNSEAKREEKQAQTERWLAQERMYEETLQSFLDRIEDLLTNHGLSDSTDSDLLRNIARTRTLTTLRRIDPKRKSILLHFLVESALVNNKNGAVIIDLSGADLQDVELHDANLEGARLSEANLQGAKLDHCNLRNAILIDTNLQSAFLWYCDLEQAVLSPEVLIARAQITNLKAANLMATNLRGTNLRDVVFDENSVLPDGTKWTPEVDLQRFTQIEFPYET